MYKELKERLEQVESGERSYTVINRDEAESILIDCALKHHFELLSSRITDALDKVRLKRETGEPARSDVEEIEALVRYYLDTFDD